MNYHGKKITVSGNTYEHRETLKAMGLRFDGTRRVWHGVAQDHSGIYSLRLRAKTGRYAVTIEVEKESAAAVAPEAKDDLAAERRELLTREISTYDADAFPGSPSWVEHAAALRALESFDASHPEVASDLRSGASTPEYVTDQHSHYNRALRGED